MDTEIKKWIQLARKISKYLLHSEQTSVDQEIIDWSHTKARAGKILHELEQPVYYAKQASRREASIRKYNWEEFILTQKQKKYRKRLRFFSYAASILLFLTAGTFVLLHKDQSVPHESIASYNIQPGSMKASLILGNGEIIALNDRLTLTEKDGTVIQNNLSGELTYNQTTTTDTLQPYNTLSVPRGGEYHLILADGTKVWINSESKLTYPTQFTTPTRQVYLQGEAYFEIAHNPAQPFYVNSSRIQVHATGTAFNVMAYDDEELLKITLTEGRVNIEEKGKIISPLTPNHQFTQNKKEGYYNIKEVDPRTATAWKNGSFFFDDEPLSSIIRKLSRWYNINILCQHPKLQQYQFSGEIHKYENVTKVLDMLKRTNEITYTIDNNQIIIHPIE